MLLSLLIVGINIPLRYGRFPSLTDVSRPHPHPARHDKDAQPDDDVVIVVLVVAIINYDLSPRPIFDLFFLRRTYLVGFMGRSGFLYRI